jgi:hypothetical protein
MDRTARNPAGFVPYNSEHGDRAPRLHEEDRRAGRPPYYQRGEQIPKHVFLRNEPTVFHRSLLCNLHYMRDLWLKLIGEFGGFVLENEPTGEGF